jgi:hypothetical protein
LVETLSSTAIDPTLLTLAVIGVTLLLVTLIYALVALLLGRVSPNWIGPIVIPLQLGLLIGQARLIVETINPGITVVWPALVCLILVAAAIVPGNVISDGIAFLRIRGLKYYQVGDRVTLAGKQSGRVTALYPFSTMLRTPKHERVRISNSRVVVSPIVVHRRGAATDLSSDANNAMARRLTLTIMQRRPGLLPPLNKRSVLGATSTHSLVGK